MEHGMKVVALVLVGLLASMTSAAIFESDFSGGVAGASIGTLDEWTVQFQSAGYSDELTADGRGHTTADGSGWIYNDLRADSAPGIAQAFNPITSTGLRYEIAINGQTDGGTGYSGNATTSIVLSENSAWSTSMNYTSGEKLVAQAIWSRATSSPGDGAPSAAGYYSFYVSVVNRYEESWDYHQYGADGGYVTQLTTVGVKVYEGDSVRMCLEVRDGAGDDVRVGYQVYDNIDGWGAWAYSAWQDPTAAPDVDMTGLGDINVNAFESDWKTRWANNTYMYVESYSAKNYTAETWFDDVIVTPEPATLGLLVLGSMMVCRKKRS